MSKSAFKVLSILLAVVTTIGFYAFVWFLGYSSSAPGMNPSDPFTYYPLVENWYIEMAAELVFVSTTLTLLVMVPYLLFVGFKVLREKSRSVSVK